MNFSDSVFQFSHNISINVYEKDTVLVKQLLHVSQMMVEPTLTSTENNHQTVVIKQPIFNDKSEYFTRYPDIETEENVLKTITGFPGHFHTLQENPNGKLFCIFILFIL